MEPLIRKIKNITVTNKSVKQKSNDSHPEDGNPNPGSQGDAVGDTNSLELGRALDRVFLPGETREGPPQGLGGLGVLEPGLVDRGKRAGTKSPNLERK